MPVPKRQHSKSRSGKRAAGKHKIPAFAGTCPSCQALVEQHAICISCGFYKGVKVMRPKSERSIERKVATQVRERSLQASEARKKIAAETQAKESAAKEGAKGE